MDIKQPNETLCLNVLMGGNKSCLGKETIAQVSNFLEKNKIQINNPSKSSSADIVNTAKSAIGCDNELCLLEKISRDIGDSTIVSKNLKRLIPKGPGQTTEWLSDSDIKNILEQVALDKSSFLALPFQMIDFDTAPHPLASVGDTKTLSEYDLVDKYKSGKRSMGVVINTDVSSGSGIHWFCLYCDMRNETITMEYFNSSGEPPMYSVRKYMNDFKNTFESKMDKNVKLIYHNKVHQRDSHSCGPYALYYILSRESGIPPDIFSNQTIPDSDMVIFRSKIFR